MNIRYNQTLDENHPTNCLLYFALRCNWHMHLTQFYSNGTHLCTIAMYLPSPLNFQPWHGSFKYETFGKVHALDFFLWFCTSLFQGMVPNRTIHPQMCFAKWCCCCWVIGPVPLPQYYFCSITMPQSNGRPTRCFQEVFDSNNSRGKMGISTTSGGQCCRLSAALSQN